MTRGGLRGRGRGGGGSGGSSRTASDHSAFLRQSNEMTHSVKLIDKNWHWEDKAMDVRDKSMYQIALYSMCVGLSCFAILGGEVSNTIEP